MGVGTAPVGKPPAALRDSGGLPLLSWRVLLLPYLGHNDLYRRFHLDEPWDGPHNKALLAEMPEVYAPPEAAVIDGLATCHWMLPVAGSSAAHDPTVVVWPACDPEPPST